MPFHGLGAPGRRAVQRAVFDRFPLDTPQALCAATLAVWRGAAFREERYAAIELPSHRRHPRLEQRAPLDFLPVYERMIVEGGWWELCDAISVPAIARLLQAEPAAMAAALEGWAHGPDPWLRRAAIVCQRTRGPACDAPLLYRCILPSIDSREFFLAKGIGWALRSRSASAPDEVRAFCATYRSRLAPLTLREALRALTD
jgi:3-methyladenine DNA glycosylase AlkD